MAEEGSNNAFNTQESSQSSGIVSSASGVKLTDISLPSYLTETETDDEYRVFGGEYKGSVESSVHHFSNLHGEFNYVENGKNDNGYVHLDDAMDKKSNPSSSWQEMTAGMMNTTMSSLDDVRLVLEEHRNLLSDEHLLNDLLQSLKDKVEREPQCMEAPQNKEDTTENVHVGGSDPVTPFVQGRSQGQGGRGSRKSVQFEERRSAQAVTGGDCTLSEPKTCTTDDKPQERDPDKLLRDLASVRWTLAGWTDVAASPPTTPTTSLTFLHQLLVKLQVLQSKNKYLEDELSAARCTVGAMKEDAVVKQALHEKKNNRLREVDSHLVAIQREWVKAQQLTQEELARLSDLNHQLQRERDKESSESNSLRNEILCLKEAIRDHETLKEALKEAQDQFSSSRQQAAEIAEENARIILLLQEREKELREAREVRIPQLEEEVSRLRGSAGQLEEVKGRLSHTTTTLRDHLSQHKVLLQRAAEAEEARDQLAKEKALVEEQVRSMTERLSSVREELHHHYQAQVQQMVQQKSQTLQAELRELETGLRQSAEQQLEEQSHRHQQARVSMQKGYEKQILALKSESEARERGLEGRVQALLEENQRLQQRQWGAISAVTSLLAPHPHPTVLGGRGEGLTVLRPRSPSANTRSAASTRPASGESTSQGKRSVAGGSLGSKETRTAIPAGLRGSSTSDSEDSVFQEGRQTVRQRNSQSVPPTQQLHQHPSHTSSSPYHTLSCRRDGALPQSQSGKLSKVCQSAEWECRSLPDLHTQDGHNDNRLKSELATWERREKVMFQPLSKKIFRASEIIQASDYTDDDDGEVNSVQGSEELHNMLKTVRLTGRHGMQGGAEEEEEEEEEAPTHDTSQDLANVTLHKLSQVSSLLSQYVT